MIKKIGINFITLPDELKAGLNSVKPLLGILDSNAISVTVKYGDNLSVSLKDNKGEIIAPNKNLFFRALSLFTGFAKKQNEFCYTEKCDFKTVGVMIDASRNAVMTVDAIKRLTAYLALMGFNLIMMYTEDTYTIEDIPRFGWMRGRYTFDEMKECDTFAENFGIEMMPCIQVLGHMAQFLRWREAEIYRDTADIMLADSKETYILIEKMMKAASAPFRSKRIHIGMDESWELGRGKYLNNHPLEPQFKIFCEHLNRVCDIAERLELKPMMWSDMFFQVCCNMRGYYREDTVITDEVKAMVPKNIELVYWHYGEQYGCDDYMLEKHEGIDRHTIFAGGMWTWTGHYPELTYAVDCVKQGIDACRKHGVDEMFMTVWGNDGHECDTFTSLLGFAYVAEFCHKGEVSDEFVKERFSECCDGNFEAFWDMAQYHNRLEGQKYANYHRRFLGKILMWNDITEGVADVHFMDNNLGEHYKKYAERFQNYRNENSPWQHLYNQAYHVFTLLSHKAYITENLIKAYKNGDKDTLSKIAVTLLPELKSDYEKLRTVDSEVWASSRKIFGWATQDTRYGGMISRLDTAAKRLNDYLIGNIETLPELDEERLPFGNNAFASYRYVYRAGIQ